MKKQNLRTHTVVYEDGYTVGLGPSMIVGRLMSLQLQQIEAVVYNPDGKKVGQVCNTGEGWNYYFDTEEHKRPHDYETKSEFDCVWQVCRKCGKRLRIK